MPGSKEKPEGGDGPSGEAAREDRGGGLRADAKWVVLLGVLSAAVTVLAYVGVSWPAIVHVLAGAAVSSPSSRPSVIEPTQPVQTSAAASPSPPSPSPSPCLFSPAQGSDSPSVGPSDFDNEATDPTQVSVATMLPQQYKDSGLVFDRTSGSVQPCPIGDESAGVQDTLSNFGCTSEVIGSYLDTSQQIQVTVWVIPLPDGADAEGAYNALAATIGNDWGNWCPATGAGSQVCQEPWRAATQGGFFGFCHRYLIRTNDLYVDLRSGNAFQSALNSAASAAINAIGPNNIPSAQC